jgi:hypothetical protein
MGSVGFKVVAESFLTPYCPDQLWDLLVYLSNEYWGEMVVS